MLLTKFKFLEIILISKYFPQHNQHCKHSSSVTDLICFMELQIITICKMYYSVYSVHSKHVVSLKSRLLADHTHLTDTKFLAWGSCVHLSVQVTMELLCGFLLH
jgi:hypothetical protein